MALNKSNLASLMETKLKSKKIKGKDIKNFTNAFSDALVTSFSSMNIVQTNDGGTIGGGAGTGKLLNLNKTVLSTLWKANLTAKTIMGKDINPFCDAASEAIVTHFLANTQINTAHAGVGLGAGTGKVTNLTAPTMGTMMYAKLVSKQIKGKNMKDFCDASADALCQHLMSLGTVIVTISGATVPIIPSSGAGAGKAS